MKDQKEILTLVHDGEPETQIEVVENEKKDNTTTYLILAILAIIFVALLNNLKDE